jgi:hypothetical protein
LHGVGVIVAEDRDVRLIAEVVSIRSIPEGRRAGQVVSLFTIELRVRVISRPNSGDRLSTAHRDTSAHHTGGGSAGPSSVSSKL